MVNYRMLYIEVEPNEDVVKEIKTYLESIGERRKELVLDFIGFEAPPGTLFRINDYPDVMKVPSNGKFITPYDEREQMAIKSVKFLDGFAGDFYYIY